jgi:hypothetical protein
MVCVDCHTAREVMGDGVAHARKSGQLRIACEDCHSERLRLVGADRVDEQSRRILRLLSSDPARKQASSRVAQGAASSGAVVATRDRTDVFVGTFTGADGAARLRGKASGEALELNAPAAACTQGRGHARLSCASCHTAWAPRCTGCHTEFNPSIPGYDHIAGREVRGSWVETGTDYTAVPPTLGVRVVAGPDGGRLEAIDTFAPGMVLTIDRGSRRPAVGEQASARKWKAGASGERDGGKAGGEPVFRRLYARVSPHTTSKGSRSCESCHNDPVALGYGRGTLIYEHRTARPRPGNGSSGQPDTARRFGEWRFTPAFEPSPYDRLPMDAWVGFLQERRGRASTRDDVRPFSVEEQKRILAVGACLTCHEGDSPVMRAALEDFAAAVRRASAKCVLPTWGR